MKLFLSVLVLCLVKGTSALPWKGPDSSIVEGFELVRTFKKNQIENRVSNSHVVFSRLGKWW